MHAQSYANAPGYLFITIGLTLSLISALVPHFDAGYRLTLCLFVTGMLPYMIYGLAVPFQRNSLTTITGLIIVIIHGWLVLSERILGHADNSNGLIFYGPLLMVILVLPVVVITLKKTGRL